MAGSVVGRVAELRIVDAFLAEPPAGARMLVLEGDPGIGKTTVWAEGIARARGLGYRILSCRAAQAEARLSFAGLGDLLGPIEPEVLLALPEPQLRAINVALLRVASDGLPTDPRTIGTGVVSLLRALAERSPVLIAVDDAQWLDRPTAHALEFAARRLDSQSVAVLATLRVGRIAGEVGWLSAVAADRAEHVRLGPLSIGALYEILKPELGDALNRPLLGRIEQVSNGNPFYAVELARAIRTEGLPEPGGTLPVPDDTRQLLARRLRPLPRGTRDELVRVSAMTRPTEAVVDRAVLAPAVDAGVDVIERDGRIDVRHPLLGAAVYAGASRDQRRRVHRELASVVPDPEEQAHHLALTIDGPDAGIADRLDEAAEHAYGRGAREVAADLMEQAARSTPDASTARRTGRFLRAARHHLKAGNRNRAKSLGEAVVESSPLGPNRAKALYLLAEIAAVEQAPSAVQLLEDALVHVGDDAALAAEIELSLGFILAAPLGNVAAADPHLVHAAELAEAAGQSGLLAEIVQFRTMTRLLTGQGVDRTAVERALALEDPDREPAFQQRPSFNVGSMYLYLGDFERAHAILADLRSRIAARGEDADLPYVLAVLAQAAWLSGRLDEAEQVAEEALRLANLTDQDLFRGYALFLRAMYRAVRGDVSGSRTDAAESLAICERFGWYHGIGQARWTQAFLLLSEGDPAGAVAVLAPVVAAVEAIGVYEWPLAMSIPDAIEALVGAGDVDHASRLTDAFAAYGARLDLPWALATSARGRALVQAASGDLVAAQASAERALVEHDRLLMPMERARTLLVLGQVLRRRGKRREARAVLEQAAELFDRLPAPMWWERARAEARRIGVRRAPVDLTENEAQVARMAARGLTNPEIAARMFLSRRTVEANLARAYRKLGVGSRAELGATMAHLEDARPS
jgi:DNA-binding CsgD family transcriptional regulator